MKPRSADGPSSNTAGPLHLRVRVELGIPKLLVKINPTEASRINVKNLGEVLLRKTSAQRGHVAVLHMSRSVPVGELVMSLKLSEILNVEEEENVELSSAANIGREVDASSAAPRIDQAPIPPSWSSTGHRSSEPQVRTATASAPVSGFAQSTFRVTSDRTFDSSSVYQRRATVDAPRFVPETTRPRQAPPVDVESGYTTVEQDAASKLWQRPNTRCQVAEELFPEDVPKVPDTSAGYPWDAPTPQRAGQHGVTCGGRVFSGQGAELAESLEPSPLPSRAGTPASSRASSHSPSSGSTASASHPRPSGLPDVKVPGVSKKSAEGGSKASQASSNVASSTTVSSPRDRRSPRDRDSKDTDADMLDVENLAPPQRDSRVEEASGRRVPVAPIVPCCSPTEAGSKAAFSRRQSGLLNKRRTLSFGSLQADVPKLPPPEPRQPVPSYWRGPIDEGNGLERSELGLEVTAEIRRWLLGETSGPQCSQVVLDRALTVLANFKLSSGCQLEVLGGPLGAIVGGYSDADWLHDEVFRKQPSEALRDAFAYFGFRPRQAGDWSNVAAEEVSLAYRRLCLRGHPSRGGSPRVYLKLQVAMELIRAFAGEAGPLDLFIRTPSSIRSATTPKTFMLNEPGRDDFILSDAMLVRELQLTAAQAEEEAGKISMDQLEEMNRALDEYILRQMCFKSEIVDEIARLHENCAYAILGVSADATDAEIKKAYRMVAMQCHPDKGGDKEDFQELHDAYEKIMEQRRSINDMHRGRRGEDLGSDDPFVGKDGEEEPTESDPADGKNAKKGSKGKNSKDEGSAEKSGGLFDDFVKEESEASEEDEGGANSTNDMLLEKATKAAEEASRYAKTAAEFAHQAAEAAETARRGREQGSREKLTKSIAHSAIVLTLTVVKAVRVVGYASLDVAAQCRVVGKRSNAAMSCVEKGDAAMNLGMEALNSALACAEVTETTASELQASGSEDDSSAWPAAASERFVGAAVKASLAAASASNAAMSAAIAAVEGSREVAKAVEEMNAKGTKQQTRSADRSCDGADDPMFAEAEVEQDDAPEMSRPSQPPSAEEALAASMKRLVAQRNNNHKVLQRLNAEILGHQENVRSFLQNNRALIPPVSGEEKSKVFRLLADYAAEARLELQGVLSVPSDSEKLLQAIKDLPLLVPFAQPQALAISVSVKARVLKMAALYDIAATMKILDTDIFQVAQRSPAMEGVQKKLDGIYTRVKNELLCNVAESSP
mmetsp:Transcript_2500/g.6273  ORF Transcript_2500/g.6273 Transcript_2500/m.6273 type:complete len:1233 (+) Transcript_2500:65-3763(+)